MTNVFWKILFVALVFQCFTAFQVAACDCECIGDCSFSATAQTAELIALVKVVAYDSYLDSDILEHDGKMPYSMTLEIVKKYKGDESRDTIKVWGDDGARCRPYLSSFSPGEYYLVAPFQLGERNLAGEPATDYDFFICNTDFLSVNMAKRQATGAYSKNTDQISLDEFERSFYSKDRIQNVSSVDCLSLEDSYAMLFFT